MIFNVSNNNLFLLKAQLKKAQTLYALEKTSLHLSPTQKKTDFSFKNEELGFLPAKYIQVKPGAH